MTTQDTKVDRYIMRAWHGGKKPPADWDGKAVVFRSGATARSTPGIVWKIGWDHSYGQTDIIAYSVAELPASVAQPTPTDEVRERMEAFVRAVADHRGPERMQSQWNAEARAIVALLDPVDGDTHEAERIAYDMEGALPRDLVLAGMKAARRALVEAGK